MDPWISTCLAKGQTIEWGKLHDIAIGTARGLAYTHEECQERITHYDIKPANIFLDANFFPKVGDFGLAKLYNRDKTHVSMICFRGTFGYSASEFLLTNYPITLKCDVYSFGMVLFEIVGRKSNVGMTVFGNPDWFPQHVWDAYENGKLEELVVGRGIREEDREKASRACKVTLWCVQAFPKWATDDECSGKDVGGRSGDKTTTKAISIFEYDSNGDQFDEFATNQPYWFGCFNK